MQPFEVYKQLQSLNQRKAGISGDLPVQIIREFAYELCIPMTDILNVSFQSSIVPLLWKQAEIGPISKSQPPTLQNIRPISLTS